MKDIFEFILRIPQYTSGLYDVLTYKLPQINLPVITCVGIGLVGFVLVIYNNELLK